MKKSILPAIFVVLIVVIGLSLLLYPSVANYVNTVAFRQAIADFQSNMVNLDEEVVVDQLASAREFNEHLLEKSSYMLFPFEVEHEEYLSLLDFSGTGLMGYVAIEKIGVYLPIYHGTEPEVLQTGVGHLEGSSLPIGGLGTHAVISGHRGLPSAKLFSDVDQLVEGDTFTVRVLREVLTYEVDQITVIEPHESNILTIEPDQDYCTLLTCTPYGVNSHRLLVRGHRIETPEAEKNAALSTAQMDSAWIYTPDTEAIIMLIVAVALLLLVVVAAVLARKSKGGRYGPVVKKPGRYLKR